MLETVQTLIGIQKDQFKEVQERISQNPRVLSQLENQSQVKLDPYFARSLLFHSESKYLDLMKRNECSFYALLENGLLKHSEGEVRDVYVTIINEEEEKESAQISMENFLQTIYKNKCSQNRDLTTIFNNQNIKETTNSVNLETPTSAESCQEIIEGWQRNPYTPYLCKISESIKKGRQARAMLPQLERSQLSARRMANERIRLQEFYLRELPLFQRTYITNLCENLDDSQKFCQAYLAQDVWNQIVNGEEPQWKMSYKCKNILEKESVSLDDLKACVISFNDSPEICRTKGSEDLPSLFPHSQCKTYSEILKVGKLKTDYHDCPGRIGNEGITNINRIIQHFDHREQDTPTTKSCASSALVNFVEMNLAYENSEAWPVRLCYQDRASEKEVCEPYIPGAPESHPMAESKIIGQILIKNYGTRKETQCKMIKKSDYNPLRLEYKTGCFIMYDEQRCSSLKCPKEIIVDQKPIEGISHKGTPLFDYFPNTFRNKKFAAVNILKETLELETKTIRNLTELTYFLNNIEDGIVHGIGCVEDLLPQFFKRTNLNQCKPVPFIVDGLKDGENSMYASVRPAIADIHSPMTIHWNHIYSAITHYQELHPSKSWMLHGLRR